MDSGIGGLGIWSEIQEILPEETLVYFADRNRFPYGGKSRLELQKIVGSVVEYLLREYSIKLLVLACNTATVASIDFLRSKYPTLPIVGVVPVIKPASLLSRKKKIVCLATDTTVKSSSQAQLIETFAHSIEVENLVSPGLVELIEKQDQKGIQENLAKVLAPFKKGNVDVLALGCTHYTLIQKEIADVLPSEIKILHSNQAVAKQVYRRLYSAGYLVSHPKNAHPKNAYTNNAHPKNAYTNNAHQKNAHPDNAHTNNAQAKRVQYSFVVHQEQHTENTNQEHFFHVLSRVVSSLSSGSSFTGSSFTNFTERIDPQLIQIKEVGLDSLECRR